MLNEQERWQREQELLDLLTDGQIPLEVYEQLLQQLRSEPASETENSSFPDHPIEITDVASLNHEVWLQKIGDYKISVIKVVREHTGKGLAATKDLVESAPCLLMRTTDQNLAERFAQDLKRVGAVCHVQGEGSASLDPQPAGELCFVQLQSCGPNKIAVIKLIRDWTGCGLKEAKALSEQTPSYILETPSHTDAELLQRELHNLGASALVVSTANLTETIASADGNPNPPRDGEYDVILTSFGDQKISIVKLVREQTGCGLKEAVDFVHALPQVLAASLSRTQAEQLQRTIEKSGGSCEIR